MLTTLMAAMMLASPEADIRAALDRQQSAWNHGDVETFMTGYDNSPETTFQGRALTRGYAQVLERYKRDYPTRERMGTLTFSEIEVKPLGNAAALVLGRFSLERSPAAGGPATGRFTLIFRKTRQGWKIIHDHTS